MPPAPLQGAKRAAAGLADVTLRRADEVKIKRERAARALVAILPPETAGFILHAREPDPRPAAEVAEDLVDVLKQHGEASLNAAAGALGRLITFVMDECPAAAALTGVHVMRFLEKVPPSAAFNKGVTFLRDWCGVDLPARGPIMRPAAKAARAPSTRNDTDEMDLMIYIGLEVISLNHPSPFAAGHAAGWAFLARHSLRFEQSSNMCLAALVWHTAYGVTAEASLAAVVLDKNPNPAEQRPRPVWGTIDGVHDPRALRAALMEMLRGREDVRCILVDTDSPSGDPAHPATTRWLRAPLRAPSRVDASLHSLLRMPPLNFSAERAGRFHGHLAKRFEQCVAKVSPDFDDDERGDVGRFAGSAAQRAELEPTADLIAKHNLTATRLPDMYAKNAISQQQLDLAVKMLIVLRHAYARALADAALLAAPWARTGPFGRPAPALAAAPAAAPLLAILPPAPAAAAEVEDITDAPGAAPVGDT